VAWPHDTTEREHVQGFPFLLHAISVGSPAGKWHGYGLLWFDEFSHGELEDHSHPQYFPKVIVEAPRPMTLAAASEEP
jgi:hypothetical protein